MSQHTPKPLSLSKDLLTAAWEKEGTPEDAGTDTLLSPLWPPSGLRIPISLPSPGYEEQGVQQWSGDDHGHDGSASLVWVATPGMLFQEDKQNKLHPLVSTNGYGATMVVCTAPDAPAQLSPITPGAFCGFFLS